MKSLHFVFLAFFILISGVVGCDGATGNSHSQMKVSSLDELNVALASVRNGATFDEVIKKIGEGQKVSDSSMPARIVGNYPERYKDGVQEEDVFVLYRIGNTRTYLQFRAGRLVNHVVEDYRPR